MDWILVDYCDVFISGWTLILTDRCIHSIGEQVMYNAKLLQICSDEEINSSTSWMAWGWVIIHLDKEKYILIKNITQQLRFVTFH